MKITLKRSCVVKPAEPTFTGRFPLSVLDQIGCIMHVPTVYFYRPGHQWLNPTDTIFNTLKSSLSKVLVHFYPLAGRVCCTGAGRMELECKNNTGVELIEVESDARLEDFGDFSPSQEWLHLFPSVDYRNTSIEELPLLFVQITKFQCGGIALSIAISHVVADGQSALHFISEWARIARGEPLAVEPFHDRNVLSERVLLRGIAAARFEHHEFKSPPALIGQSSNEKDIKKKTAIPLFKLTKEQVEALKNKANERRNDSNGRPYSRYEVITAHMWRTACKASKLLEEQQTMLAICIDVRRRLEPSLPQGYFGNAVMNVVCFASSGELISNPIGYAAKKIREAILEGTNDYVLSALQFLENQKDLSQFQDLYALKHDLGPLYRSSPNLSVISWLALPLLDMDFGWGKEIYMSPGVHEDEGDCLILPGLENDGSVVAALCLQEQHIEDYKKFFYQDDIHG